MAYKVGAKKEFGETNWITQEGFYKLKIRSAKIETSSWVSEEIKAMGLKPNMIRIFLSNDNNDTISDNIFQNMNDETFELEFQSWKMDLYSHGVNFPEGTSFNTVQEWLNALIGKEVVVKVEVKNNFANVRAVYDVETGLKLMEESLPY